MKNPFLRLQNLLRQFIGAFLTVIVLIIILGVVGSAPVYADDNRMEIYLEFGENHEDLASYLVDRAEDWVDPYLCSDDYGASEVKQDESRIVFSVSGGWSNYSVLNLLRQSLVNAESIWPGESIFERLYDNGEMIDMINSNYYIYSEYSNYSFPTILGFSETEDYESYDDYSDDITEKGKDSFQDGQTVYILWKKHADKVEISVKPPECGDTVSIGVDWIFKPDTVPEVDCSDNTSYSYSYWATTDIAPYSGYMDAFEGEFEGGNTYYFASHFHEAWGYYYNASTKILVNGEEPENYSCGATSCLQISKKIKCEHDWEDWEVVKNPTTTSNGEMRRVCKGNSEHVEKKTINKIAVKNKVLLAQMTSKNSNSMNISWMKVSGADGYDIFLAPCNTKGKKHTMKKVKTVKGNKTFRWTKSSLKKKTSYKAYVKAYTLKNGNKKYIGSSPVVHAYTSGGNKKYTNPKSVSVKKAAVYIKAGKTYSIKGDVKKLKKKKKLINSSHAPKLRYLSSDSSIAKVSSSGSITGKKKGTCTVYVYAINGVRKTVRVTVK